MSITKHWVPFDLRLHAGLHSIYPLVERDSYQVLVAVRAADGSVVHEQAFNDGNPISGVSSLTLDFTSQFGTHMAAAKCGLTEVTFVSERPFTGAGCHYFVGPRGFTCFLNGPLTSINERNPRSRYRGFSVHFMDDSVDACGLVVMNVSTNASHSRVAHLAYEVRDEQGTIVQSGALDVQPFGVRWIALSETLDRDSAKAYTMFGTCDGTALISLIWTHLKGGGLGIDHTQPPPTQWLYGDDLTPTVKNQLRRLRARAVRMLLYKLNRVDERPLLQRAKR